MRVNEPIHKHTGLCRHARGGWGDKEEGQVDGDSEDWGQTRAVRAARQMNEDSIITRQRAGAQAD